MASEDNAAGDGGDGDAPAVTAPMTGPEPERIAEPLDRDLAAGRVLGGRYEITEHLGAGGMGVVYAARDRLLEMPVALKFVRPAVARDPAEQSRLWKEVRLAQSISHPNVVRTFTLDRQDGHLFIVMELLGGCTLADRVRQGPLPVDEAVRIARSILTGLAAAHDRNIIHRDIKPENTRLCGDGRVVLMDFGIARAQQVHLAAAEPLAGGPGRGRHTALAGTPGYMAPEVLTGARATAAADLYSVGVVLHEMLVGRRSLADTTAGPTPTGGGSPAIEVRTPPDVPAHVAAVLATLLAPAPALRYRSAQEALDALDGLMSAPAGVAGPTAAPRRRRRQVVAGLGAVVAASAATVAIVGGTRDAARPPAPHTTGTAAPTFATLTDPARPRWTRSTIPVCWEAQVQGHEREWVQAAVRGAASWHTHVGVDFIGWRACEPTSTGIRIAAGDTMIAHDGVGRPRDAVARIELDLGAAPERTWARCVATNLDRRRCIQAETHHLVGRVLGFADAADVAAQPSCSATGRPTAAGDTHSITTRCGAAALVQPLDLAAAQAVYGIKDDVDRGNLAVTWNDRKQPNLIAFLVEANGHVGLASPNAAHDRWQWTDVGGPVGWSGRFTAVSVPDGRGHRRLHAFGVASDGGLHEYDASGATPVWHDRGGPGDLIGSPTAVTYAGEDGRAHVHVFATSARGQLHEYAATAATGSWHDRGGTGVVGSPAAVSHVDDDGRRHIDVFVRDRDGLLQLGWNERAWTWIDRGTFSDRGPAPLVGSPTVTTTVGSNGGRYFQVDVVGADGHLYILWSVGGKFDWDDHTGPGLIGDATVVAATDEEGAIRHNVFAVGADGRLHDYWWNVNGWTWIDEGGPGNLVATAAAFVHAAADDGVVTDLLVVDAEGRAHHLAWTPSTRKWTAIDGPRLAPIQR